jgi:hypothetical protein
MKANNTMQRMGASRPAQSVFVAQWRLAPAAHARRLGVSMNTSEIDNAILSVSESSWRKVAMIIAKAVRVEGIGVADDEAGHEIIASRIEALVLSGRLTAQGDLKRWRYSEVRLP